MENKQEMIFVPMNFQEVPPTAPETVRGRVSFDVDKMIAFLQEHRNEKGYVNTKMMKSKATGKIYFILDTFQAKPKVEAPEAPHDPARYPTDVRGKEIFESALSDEELERLKDIPFN